MAYLLRFDDSTSNYIILPNVLAGASTFEVEFDVVQRTLSTTFKSVFNSSGGNSFAFYFWNNNGSELSVTIGGSRKTLAYSGFVAGQRYVIRATYDGSTLRYFVDGVQRASVAAAGSVSILSVSWVGLRHPPLLTWTYMASKVTQDSALVRNYDPSASNGTGTVLIDTVNGQDGTQAGTWPSNDSEWVYYDAGGAVTASVASTMPQMSVAASVVVSAPAFTSAITFGMPQFAIAASSTITAPVFSSTIAFSMPQFTVDAASNVFAPGNSAIASFAMPQFAVDAAASSAAPIFSSVIAFEMPQMVADVAANSVITGNSAAIDCAMPQMVIDVSASSSAPIYSVVINTTMPQFSVIAYSGGIIRVGGDGTHIEQVAISTELLYNYLNTHIDALTRSTHIERL